MPTVEQARSLARAYGADDATSAELVRRARVAREGVKDKRLVIQRGDTLAMQQRWRRLERDSELVRAYQPAMVLGVLQTAAYAAVVLRRPVDSAEVRDRMLRHDRLLAGPKPMQVLIQTEGALRFTVGSAAVMSEQVAALLAASERPHVRLGVIPADRAVDRVTTNAFHLYDHGTAVLGVEVAAAVLTDAADLSHFEALFAALERMAVFGDEARALLERIGDDFRR